MFGPRIVTGEKGQLVMRAIEAEDLEDLPTKLHPKVTQFLSTDTVRDLAELVTNREKSHEYDYWKHARDRVTWGIFTGQADNREQLIGYTGFTGYSFNGQPPGWYPAESYCVLFKPEAMGKGAATATHPLRSAFAFSMGVSCLRSSVVLGNERSARAITSAGYAFLGTDHPDNDLCKRYEFHQYHPHSGTYAETNALKVASRLEIASLDILAVENSKRHVAALLQTMPTVVEAAETWMAEHGPQLEYLPTEVRRA